MTDENDMLNGADAWARPTAEVPPGLVKCRYPTRPPFNLLDIMPVPCRRAPFVVRVNGRDYAGFDEKSAAVEAMHAWRQRWPAAAGLILDIKEQ